MNAKCSRPAITPQGGFTIVELLVVIGIIALLVGILLPSLNMVRLRAYAANTQARIRELADGARLYHEEHRIYPGQDAEGDLGSKYTGTQVLAACLFRFESYEEDIPNDDMQDEILKKGLQTIVPLRKGDLSRFGNKPNSISDRFGADTMPILYYPSRLGLTGLGQYVEQDNAEYTDYYFDEDERPGPDWLKKKKWQITGDDTDGQDDFHKYIKDRSFHGDASNTPYNPGEFLLIGAGIDRQFGTPDDLRNWSSP